MTDHHFLSYSNADAAEFALWLADELTAGPPPYHVWLDKRDLRAGRDWDEQIVEAIRDCETMLYVMTGDSVDPTSVTKQEWTRALKYGKPIVPLRLHVDAETPFRLANRQYIDFSGDRQVGLAKLRQHLAWLSGPEGQVQILKDRRADLRRDLRRAQDESSQQRIASEIAELEKQIGDAGPRAVQEPAQDPASQDAAPAVSPEPSFEQGSYRRANQIGQAAEPGATGAPGSATRPALPPLPESPEMITAEVNDWTDGAVAIIGRLPESGLRGPVGAGFVVSNAGLIVTCAHVLAQAEWPYQRWDTPIEVRFKATNRYAKAFVLQRCFQSSTEGDFAVLLLEDDLPGGVSALPLGGTEQAAGHKVYMWGYPAGHEGLLGEGEVLGLVPERGRDVLQLRSTEVTKGYSGGPIWDPELGRVIGMTLKGTEADAMGRLGFTTFAMPGEGLVDFCRDLLILTPPGVVKVDMSGYDNRPLYGVMREKLSKGDTEDLAFQLEGVEYEDLPGSTKSAKIRELIGFMERRDRVPELLEQLAKIRESVDWYEAAGVKLR